MPQSVCFFFFAFEKRKKKLRRERERTKKVSRAALFSVSVPSDMCEALGGVSPSILEMPDAFSLKIRRLVDFSLQRFEVVCRFLSESRGCSPENGADGECVPSVRFSSRLSSLSRGPNPKAPKPYLFEVVFAKQLKHTALFERPRPVHAQQSMQWGRKGSIQCMLLRRRRRNSLLRKIAANTALCRQSDQRRTLQAS